MGKKSVSKKSPVNDSPEHQTAGDNPTVDELLDALEQELQKPLPPSPLLDLLDNGEEAADRRLPPPVLASQYTHIPEFRRDEGLGQEEKQMIGRMWHQLADKFADEEEPS